MSDWARERVSKMPRTDDGMPIAWHDLDEEDFPFRVQIHDEDSGALVWEQTIHGPSAIAIPRFAPRKVSAIVTYLRSGLTTTATSEGQTSTYYEQASTAPELMTGPQESGTDPS